MSTGVRLSIGIRPNKSSTSWAGLSGVVPADGANSLGPRFSTMLRTNLSASGSSSAKWSATPD